jgi:hypothetical protein
MSTEVAPRPPRPRRPPKRKIPVTLAMVLMGIALLAGVVVGYAARGDSAPGGLVTETRTIPVETTTTPVSP